MKDVKIKYKELIEMYEGFLLQENIIRIDSLVKSYTNHIKEFKRILDLLERDAITPEIFDKLSDRNKWMVHYDLKGRVNWFCEGCGCSQHEPYGMADGELCCSNCDWTLTRRTGGGQNDPFGWKFEYNEKEIRRIKLKKLNENEKIG